MLNITQGNFQAEVENYQGLCFVDFYADWCGPCKMMAPIVEELDTEYKSKIKVGKCNIDDNMMIAQKFRIMSIPTMILFQNGQAIETLVGARSKTELKEILNRYC